MTAASGLSGADRLLARLDGLAPAVLAAIAAKSAALAQGDGAEELAVRRQALLGEAVVTVLGDTEAKAAAIRTLGGADKRDVPGGRVDPGALLAARAGEIEAEIEAAALLAAQSLMGG